MRVRISACPHDVESHFRHDFHYFLRPSSKESPDLWLRFVAKPPKWGKGRRIGRAELFFSKPGERRLKYFDSTWIEYRPEAGVARVLGQGTPHLYEAALSVVLSFVGEWLDRRGIHRVHGLGVSRAGEGALLLAPSGTGKSTLALGLLKRSALELLSDDTPFVTADGEMLSFPQRIATKERPTGFSSRHVRRFRRARYGEKYVVGAEAFAKRIGDRACVRYVLVTDRKRGQPRVRALPRWRLAWPLVKWLVAGLETPQMWELFLRPSGPDVGRKTKIFVSRVRAAAGLMKRARAFRLVLGEDAAANAEFVARFLGEPPCA